MNREELQQLAQKILTQQASDEEIADYIRRFNRAQEADAELDPNWEKKKAPIFKNILKEIRKPRVSMRIVWIRIAAAALIIITAGIGAFFIFQSTEKPSQATNLLKNDFKAGTNSAILTLANGRHIVLDKNAKGALANQSGIVVKRNNLGQLVYALTGNLNSSQPVQYNTISTPRGSSQQVLLPDGTHVWLNAASSLSYPTAFHGKDRTVSLTGEGYFEVAKDKSKPFRVKTNLQTIEVLGTHFNINAYDDEPNTATTLLEGSVKITNGRSQAILTPFEESHTTSADSKISINKDVNTDMITAWKDNEFNFNNSDTKAILRQISRWYDVDIEYRGNVPNYSLNAEISRNVNASEVLKILEYTGLKFKIEGRKIIVQ